MSDMHAIANIDGSLEDFDAGPRPWFSPTASPRGIASEAFLSWEPEQSFEPGVLAEHEYPVRDEVIPAAIHSHDMLEAENARRFVDEALNIEQTAVTGDMPLSPSQTREGAAYASVKRKGRGEPKRRVKAGGNPVTGSRGGGRPPMAGVHRQIIHVPIDHDGIPQFTLTKGAKKNLEILKRSLHCATAVGTSLSLPHQPHLGVHSFEMPENFVFGLFGHKNSDSTRKFFTQMGFRYATRHGMMQFDFNVECYKLHGWKLHQLPAGTGPRKPELSFFLPAS